MQDLFFAIAQSEELAVSHLMGRIAGFLLLAILVVWIVKKVATSKSKR